MKAMFVLVLMLVCLCGLSSDLTALPQDDSLPTVTDNDQAARAKLRRSISVQYSDIPLNDLIADLTVKTELQIVLHKSVFDHTALMEEDEFSFESRSIRASTLLDRLLDKHECTYKIEDGMLIILSSDFALDWLSLKVFDCRQLLSRTPTKKILVANWISRGGFGSTGLDPKREFGIRDPDPDEKTQKTDKLIEKPRPDYTAIRTYAVEPSEQVMSLLQETVDPDSWEENGGSARIYEINGLVVITQTEKNLRQIRSLLAQLSNVPKQIENVDN